MLQPTNPGSGISLSTAAKIVHEQPLTQQMELINQGTDEVILEGSGYGQSVSADGRFLAFAAQNKPRQWRGDWSVGPQPPFHLFLRDRLAGQTTQLNLTTRGQAPAEGIVTDGGGKGVSMSADGRIIAFASAAPDLVEGDHNGCTDVFVYDRQQSKLRRISVSSDGTEANGSSYEPVVSANGEWVAFRSAASNLVAGDRNGHDDIFLHHISTGKTSRVSVASDGSEGRGWACMPAISGDGRFVAFSFMGTGLADLPIPKNRYSSWESDYGIIPQIYVHDCQSGETRLISRAADGTPASGDCVDTAISSDGATVAFASRPNLSRGDTNLAEGVKSMCVYTWRADSGVQLAAEGARDPALSADGSRLAYTSSGRIAVRDKDGSVQFVERPEGQGNIFGARLSDGGNTLAFTSVEKNEDLPDQQVTRVFTFDLDRMEALVAWAGAREAEAAKAQTIVVGDDFVSFGGMKVPRRR